MMMQYRFDDDAIPMPYRFDDDAIPNSSRERAVVKGYRVIIEPVLNPIKNRFKSDLKVIRRTPLQATGETGGDLF